MYHKYISNNNLNGELLLFKQKFEKFYGKDLPLFNLLHFLNKKYITKNENREKIMLKSPNCIFNKNLED